MTIVLGMVRTPDQLTEHLGIDLCSLEAVDARFWPSPSSPSLEAVAA